MNALIVVDSSGEPLSEIRISRHPFILIGYCVEGFKTPNKTDRLLYASALNPGLTCVVWVPYGQVTFVARGKSFRTLKEARAESGRG